MGFSNPTESEYAEVESGKYIARIDHLDDGEDYGNGPTILWSMELADKSGPIFDEKGDPLLFRGMTSQSLGRKAKAREWAEAFLGQDIAGWTGDQVTASLPGTVATILIGPVKDSKGEMRQRIVSIEPFAGAAEPVAAAAGPAKASAAPKGNPFG